ncbi:MAG: Cell division protease FtsH, partial [Deltaproteobacteria bacterium]|nr:Cell division protease FtsH [Deltaproteobacteria bacterium]
KMVCEWGMSEKLGPVTFGQKQESIFLGRDITRHQDYSEATSRDIDQEVRGIVLAAYGRAKTLLETNLDVLHRVAKTLLEKEVVDGAEILRIIHDGNSRPGPADAPAPAGAPA